MNTIIGEYATHEKAIKAVEELKRAGYPIQQVSLIGKAIIVDDLMHVRYNNRWISNILISICAIIGPILGILTGVKVFEIPGFDFLFGTGPLIGALAGFSLGALIGGIISLIAILAIKSHAKLKYHEKVEEQGFQVIVHGTVEDAKRAKEILNDYKDELEVK
ncbi:MAG TPA: hypothetical protein PKK00_05915 [Bacteroidales bacterium]|nr:hypothetical protein [Bacteroidales bacterium]HPS16832.1 hypothetical protein [Bacteroidales bacterium]